MKKIPKAISEHYRKLGRAGGIKSAKARRKKILDAQKAIKVDKLINGYYG